MTVAWADRLTIDRTILSALTMGAWILRHPMADGTATVVIAMDVVNREDRLTTGGITYNATGGAMVGIRVVDGNKAESGDGHN